jgi:hypothetical protein
MNERFVERMNRAIALGLEWPYGERRSHASLRSSTVTGAAAAVDPQEVRGRRARGLSAAGVHHNKFGSAMSQMGRCC